MTEEYTRKEYGDLADIITLHDQMVDSGELEHDMLREEADTDWIGLV